MCGERPLPELYIIFVLDDSVDFDGFVVPDRMEALLSSALENHRIRSTREHLSTARRFHICVAGYMIEVRMAGEDDPDVGHFEAERRDVLAQDRCRLLECVSIRM